MEKASKLLLIIIVVTIICMILCATSVHASQKILDEKTESALVEIKDREVKTLEDYQAKYGSDSYGMVAYILNIIRTWSIPVCFVGIAISSIYKSVIGIRKLDTLEQGRGAVVTFVTILIICQVLPLIFAVVVKFGRG